ncbi:MAG: glycosyltransferase family 4 protein [Phycisphaerales bacterium]|nr:glycosyltransferase family 4 protein [Planctomycetota bacterium]MCH8508663.1 glycosyltransferase family 4 protein [Phycisphaerales bacterium]
MAQPLKLWRRAYREVTRQSAGARHHLEQAAVPVRVFPGRVVDADFVPDADVVFASWWAVWREVAGWPASKGLKVHYARHHELHGGPEDEVHAAYRLPGPKVVISSWLGRVMQEYGHAEILRVPNGVNWAQFDSSPRGRQDRPTVGMLMRDAVFKDTPVGLEAMRLVRERIPEVRLIGFGQQAFPGKWAAPEGLEYHERPAQDLIPKLYQSCDCWVVPSRSEGFGMPGLEAAAGHCPIVSTRCGGPEDYVRDGVNGYLVDVGDANAMADRIVAILRRSEEDWRRMSAASYEIAREFDWDRSAEKLEAALYRWLEVRDDEALAQAAAGPSPLTGASGDA